MMQKKNNNKIVLGCVSDLERRNIGVLRRKQRKQEDKGITMQISSPIGVYPHSLETKRKDERTFRVDNSR